MAAPAEGDIVRVIVDQNEDLGRPGMAGLFAELEAAPASRAEAPGSWAPVAVSHGPLDPARRSALEAFHRWLDDEREATRS
ncbi:MAG TPA: hypothetical protein VM345_17690 [Acidimicrobiales bacterium]|nr:hypothetical protein [Acidimicrobiales bacterium]